MNFRLFRLLAPFLAVAALMCTSCSKQVAFAPGEDDLIVLNGCVISACNYLAAVKAQHSLERNFWARILLVRYSNHSAGHAYCVWETDGTVYGYDRNAGAFPIPIYTRDPQTIATVLAQELSKHVHDTLAVSEAEFVQPSLRVTKF